MTAIGQKLLDDLPIQDPQPVFQPTCPRLAIKEGPDKGQRLAIGEQMVGQE